MQPSIRKHLLWDFDFAAFDFFAGASIVIERVIERGDINDWKAIVNFYGEDAILFYSNKSKQLSKRDKNFTNVIIKSPLIH
ncbi:MAG: hypothetical protein JST29_02895 [Bacteroidetes bacterium]|nr:hypothetical protein [Bacteroidota bacterium]MBS1591913.1 hypothetical protein [Bacteroidota bacterium]